MPKEAKPLIHPPIKLFSIFHRPPMAKEAAPAPPIQVFHAVPPPVATFRLTPPCVQTFRIDQQAPRHGQLRPPGVITVFHVQTGEPECAPSLVTPPITVVVQPPPQEPKCAQRRP
jgi:hypothetical protein